MSSKGVAPGQDVVVVEFAGFRCVALAREVASFETDASTLELGDATPPRGPSGPSVDLDHLLGVAPSFSGEGARYLEVMMRSHSVWFRTQGHLHLSNLENRAFFRLPQVLRRVGCEQWIAGVALLQEAHLGGVSPAAIWIDLVALSEAVAATERPT